jgi:hypothetical protein
LPCQTFLPQTDSKSSLPDAPSNVPVATDQITRANSGTYTFIQRGLQPKTTSIFRDHALEQVTIAAEV